jgi:hypothetical protein
MQHYLIVLLSIFALFSATDLYSKSPPTQRIPEISNEKVNVWQTLIYPSAEQILKMHRHEHARVVVAFNSGTLKITDNKQKTHFLRLEKGHSYYLEKDISGEIHSDENISQHPIKVVVIELNY